MAQTALAPRQLRVTGEFTHVFVGCAGGSGTSTVVSLPGNCTVRTVIVSGATSATAPYCDTISANTFTVTSGSGDLFTYIAYVIKGF